MIRALYSAASGMVAQQVNMDVIANNLANVGTPGYKRARAEFADLLYEQLFTPDSNRPAGVQVGHGTQLAAVQRSFAPGTRQETRGQFDIAIQGAGFLRVQGADGQEFYTRSGNLRLDGARRLVTAAGAQVLGVDGPIVIPEDAEAVKILPNGTITADGSGALAGEVLGRLNLARFANPNGLLAAGDNLLAAAPAAGQPGLAAPGEQGTGALAQGFLEAANVEVVSEMVSLITAQRVFEISSRALQGADEMLGIANQLRR